LKTIENPFEESEIGAVVERSWRFVAVEQSLGDQVTNEYPNDPQRKLEVGRHFRDGCRVPADPTDLALFERKRPGVGLAGVGYPDDCFERKVG